MGKYKIIETENIELEEHKNSIRIEGQDAG